MSIPSNDPQGSLPGDKINYPADATAANPVRSTGDDAPGEDNEEIASGEAAFLAKEEDASLENDNTSLEDDNEDDDLEDEDDDMDEDDKDELTTEQDDPAPGAKENSF